jgi:hypothetical protein
MRPGRMTILRDELDGRSNAMVLALTRGLLRSRGGAKAIEYEPKGKAEKRFVERHSDRARDYAGMGFVEIAAECIGHRGNVYSAQRADILTRAFESTSDYPNLCENVLNKVLLARYELHMPTYRKIAAERPFNDFRPHPQVRAGEFPPLQPVSETGELMVGTSNDYGTNVSMTPYGVIFPISRQMLVNDELGAVDQILASAGRIVAIWENQTFFSMLLSNPTLTEDNTAVFASAHNNYVAPGSGAAPSVSTYGSARQALRNMKTPDGNYYLDVKPGIFVTGSAQETAAEQMRSRILPMLTTSVNPFEDIDFVSDPSITTTAWYLFADPDEQPNFIFGNLKGSNGPRIRIFSPFGYQGLKISVEEDFGVGAIDFRGAYLNSGS